MFLTQLSSEHEGILVRDFWNSMETAMELGSKAGGSFAAAEGKRGPRESNAEQLLKGL